MRARLLIDPVPLSGKENMKRDVLLLEEMARTTGLEESLPTLRLYRWKVPTVSLGRFQPLYEVDSSYAQKNAIDIVRRPTGGKGVLHDDELTYSFICSTDHGIPAGVEASYAYIARALVSAFKLLEIDLDAQFLDHGVTSTDISENSSPGFYAGADRARNVSGACYLSASPADICTKAGKLSGSAQVWRKNAVLQHGCFTRSRSIEREARLFKLNGTDRERLRKQASSLEELLGHKPSYEQIQNAIITSFESELELDFV